jgi:hypothetical protein
MTFAQPLGPEGGAIFTCEALGERGLSGSHGEQPGLATPGIARSELSERRPRARSAVDELDERVQLRLGPRKAGFT